MNNNRPSETEWQPVLYSPVEGCVIAGPWIIDKALIKGKKIIRVRPTPDRSRRYICNAKMFFQVHPDDAEKFWGIRGRRLFLCEHKILSAD